MCSFFVFCTFTLGFLPFLPFLNFTMSQVQVLSKETAEKEVAASLNRKGYAFLGKPNDDVIKKVKLRPSRGIQVCMHVCH